MRKTASALLLLLLPCLSIQGCATTGSSEKKNSNPVLYHYQMGLSYLGESNYTDALIELTEADRLEPDNPEYLYRLATAFIGKRRLDLAEKKLLRAIELKPAFSAARNDLGYVYLETKQWDEAIRQFKIVKDDLFYRDSENAAINLALSYMGKGEYPKAIHELTEILKINPRNPVARLSIGRVLFSMGKTEEAIEEFRKAITIYKDYGAAYHYLGIALMKQNRIEEARTAFSEALRIFPDSDIGKASRNYLDLIK